MYSCCWLLEAGSDLVPCCVVGDSSGGGDAGSAVMSTASTDQPEEPVLRSWPPKSHTGGAPVSGKTASPMIFSASSAQEFLILQSY